MVASLNPDYGHFDLVPFEPRIWMGGPSENCWRMYYNNSLSQWELEGGNGLVRYTQSSTFDCNGPNIFDLKLVDLTLQAPNSITVYPLSPLPCECPGMFEPNMGTLNLTGYPPTIRSHLWPTMGAFALTPYAPEISESGDILTACSTLPVPRHLIADWSGFVGACVCWNGYSTTLDYNSGTGKWELTSGGEFNSCSFNFMLTMQCVGSVFQILLSDLDNPPNTQGSGPTTGTDSPFSRSFNVTFNHSGICFVGGLLRIHA